MSDTELAPQRAAAPSLSPASGSPPQQSSGFQHKVARRLARKGVEVNGSLATPPSAYGLSSYNYAPALRAVALSEVADSLAAGSGAGQAQMQQDHGHGAAAAPAAASDVADHGFSGGGHAIPHKAQMEQSFGRSFDHVTAYSDGPARKANEDLNSHAYAMGNQIAFKTANPAPELVAHELTHTIQQGGVSAKGGGGGGGIDTSGEGEAEAVEAAVKSGRPAHTALSSAGGGTSAVAQKRRGPALSADPKFGMGLSFSMEGFEKSYDYTIWKGHSAWPTPVPGLNFVVDPSVKVSAKGGAKWGGESKGDVYAQLGVAGEVGIGLSGGIPNVAEIYGTLNPGVEGAFTLAKHAPAAAAEPAAGQAAAAAPKSDWSLQGTLTVKGAAKIGVSLAGGIVDQSFELGSIEICKLTGVYFDQTGFRRDKLGFEWGTKMKEAYEGLKKAIERAKAMGRAGIEAAQSAGRMAAAGASTVYQWATSW